MWINWFRLYYFQIIKEGDEEEGKPDRNDLCRIRFEGRLKKGTVIEKEDDIEVQLGDGDVSTNVIFCEHHFLFYKDNYNNILIILSQTSDESFMNVLILFDVP